LASAGFFEALKAVLFNRRNAKRRESHISDTRTMEGILRSDPAMSAQSEEWKTGVYLSL